MRDKVFLTGPPGCGKTTVIRRFVDTLNGPATGFFTSEIREGSGRTGFSIRSLEGRKAVLSHVDYRNAPRVGRYGVDVAAFEAVALPSLRPPDRNTVIVIDEIGMMECFSQAFIDAVRALLEGANPILGTVASKSKGFPEEVRRHPAIRLVEVSAGNRDALPDRLASAFAVDR